jgi:preprotein translocase subunit SecE
VARNRKRAKARQARRADGAPGAEPGLATAPVDAPDPIEHASPDVELAEAQLAMGRPELARETEPEPEDESPEEAEEELGDEPFGEGPDMPGVFPERPRVQEGGDGGGAGEPPEGEELVAPGGRTPEPRAQHGNRLINFLQGSWRELQRVQWPDRRQVMQATGVVIGFVIVAGVFLGVADFVATKLMNYILTGHFK